jgi:hypothetical protein
MNIENMNKSDYDLYNGLGEFSSSNDFINSFHRMHYTAWEWKIVNVIMQKYVDR